MMKIIYFELDMNVINCFNEISFVLVFDSFYILHTHKLKQFFISFLEFSLFLRAERFKKYRCSNNVGQIEDAFAWLELQL